jgi:hypothetical protein
MRQTPGGPTFAVLGFVIGILAGSVFAVWLYCASE